MELGDLLVKIANNARLTPQELDELKRMGNETQQRNSFVAGNTTPQNALNVAFPFAPIFSEVFTVNKSSFVIPTPGDFKHLLLIISGRDTSVNDFSGGVLGRFNGDTGANYFNQYIYGSVTTAYASYENNTTSAIIGGLAGGGSADGKAVASVTFLPHYRSNFHKSGIAMEKGYSAGGNVIASLTSFSWTNTAPIETITMYSAAVNIAAGSVVSLYGIV